MRRQKFFLFLQTAPFAFFALMLIADASRVFLLSFALLCSLHFCAKRVSSVRSFCGISCEKKKNIGTQLFVFFFLCGRLNFCERGFSLLFFFFFSRLPTVTVQSPWKNLCVWPIYCCPIQSSSPTPIIFYLPSLFIRCARVV